MFSSGIISILFELTPLGEILFWENGFMPDYMKFPIIVAVTTVIWLITTFITKPEKKEVLNGFYLKIQPGGPGWSKIIKNAASSNIDLVTDKQPWSVPSGIIAMLLGLCLIYSILFATGYIIYGNYTLGILLIVISIIAAIFLIKIWKRIKAVIL
jgi:hypothetical protein